MEGGGGFDHRLGVMSGEEEWMDEALVMEMKIRSFRVAHILYGGLVCMCCNRRGARSGAEREGKGWKPNSHAHTHFG